MAIKKDTTEEVKEAPEETAGTEVKKAASKHQRKSYFGCFACEATFNNTKVSFCR